jgi:hypothetical protein
MKFEREQGPDFKRWSVEIDNWLIRIPLLALLTPAGGIAVLHLVDAWPK